jgi:hypothetical protein
MFSRRAAAEIGKTVLKSKYAKWVICASIGFIAEHAAGSLYDKYIIQEADASESE